MGFGKAKGGRAGGLRAAGPGAGGHGTVVSVCEEMQAATLGSSLTDLLTKGMCTRSKRLLIEKDVHHLSFVMQS